MKNLLLTFDLEEFVCPAERKLGISKERLFEVSRYGLKNIIRILKENNIRATFFTTYEFAKTNDMTYIKTSSKENTNVKLVFDTLIKQLLESPMITNIKSKSIILPLVISDATCQDRTCGNCRACNGTIKNKCC